MRRVKSQSFILPFLLLLFTPVVIFGQNSDELCQAFINRAFGDMGNNCANLDANEACYAYGNFGEVTSSFYVDGTAQVIREDVFAEAAERLSLLEASEVSSLESLTTADFSLADTVEESRWGLASLELSANLPEESAIVALFGGGRIENAVYPEDAVQLGETITVSSNGEVSLFGSPEALGYLVPDVVVGTADGELSADAISADGEWLRVLFSYERDFGERTTAWVKVSDLSSAEGLDTLPVWGADDYTAMQSFFLSNSFSEPECPQVPAGGLLLQGPSEIETDFVLNEMPVRVTSSVYFRQISSNRLQVIALNGFTILYPDSADETVIPEGFSRILCLKEAQDLGIDGLANDFAIEPNCPDAETEALTGAPLAALRAFEAIPSNLLNYDINAPFEVCPSGVGNVQCILVAASAARIEAKCEEGLLPEAVCAAFGF